MTLIAPEVAAKLDGARATVAALTAQMPEIALAVVTERKPGAASQKLKAHHARISEAKVSVAELEFLMEAATKADRLSGIDQRYEHLLATHDRISAEFAAQTADATLFSELAEKLVGTHQRMIDRGHHIETMTPAELGFRPGFAFRGASMINGRAFPAGLDGLIAHELYRHANIQRPEDRARALPEAKPLNFSVILNPEAAEGLASSIARLGDSILENIRTVIDLDKSQSLRTVNNV
jgi:hypothetical protein